MSKSPRLDKARRAFEDFTGHKAVTGYRAALDSDPVAGYRLGSTVGIAYEAKRDGKTEQYFHRFSRKARPDLVSKDDGSQLYLTGGDYVVTDRGIEDMPGLYVVNPSRRRKRKGVFKRRKRHVISVRANPVRRRKRRYTARRRRSTVTVMRANPVHRRRRRRVGLARHRVMRMRRNPVANRGGKLNMMEIITTGAMVGAGAVASELVMGFLPLPAQLKQGVPRHLTKGAVGVVGGIALAKFANKRLGTAFAVGAVTIAAHDWLKEVILRYMPAARFGGYGEYMGEYLGEYEPVDPAIGYYNPAMSVSAADLAGADSASTSPVGI